MLRLEALDQPVDFLRRIEAEDIARHGHVEILEPRYTLQPVLAVHGDPGHHRLIEAGGANLADRRRPARNVGADEDDLRLRLQGLDAGNLGRNRRVGVLELIDPEQGLLARDFRPPLDETEALGARVGERGVAKHVGRLPAPALVGPLGQEIAVRLGRMAGRESQFAYADRPPLGRARTHRHHEHAALLGDDRRRAALVEVAGREQELGALFEDFGGGIAGLGRVRLCVGPYEFDLVAEDAAFLVEVVHRDLDGGGRVAVIGGHPAALGDGEADDQFLFGSRNGCRQRQRYGRGDQRSKQFVHITLPWAMVAGGFGFLFRNCSRHPLDALSGGTRIVG